MQTRHSLRNVAWAAAAVLAVSAPALADSHGLGGVRDQIQLTFSAPVEVPGATLKPGTYHFEVLGGSSDESTVRIWKSDQTTLVTTAEVIPMKRTDTSGIMVVDYRPTVLGSSPMAMKGWFYPKSMYGYQLVYPAKQAADIAHRTDTRIVGQQAGADGLVLIDAYGKHMAWHPDMSAAKGLASVLKERAAAS